MELKADFYSRDGSILGTRRGEAKVQYTADR